MPIFEYVCKSCQHAFELIVLGKQRPRCPACGEGRVERQHSVFSAAVKGNGGNGESAAGDHHHGACGTCGDPRGPGSCDLD